MKAIRGISFPFRVGSRGGVVMTKVDFIDPTHLAESIQQIVSTQIGERVMEIIGSNISTQIFEPNDESTHTLIKYEIVEAISNYEKRVGVTMADIDLYENEEKVYATINFEVLESGLRASVDTQIGG